MSMMPCLEAPLSDVAESAALPQSGAEQRVPRRRTRAEFACGASLWRDSEAVKTFGILA